MKKQSALSRLFEYAGGYKYLTIASWVLSAISAVNTALINVVNAIIGILKFLV